jgi:hypothetical protein
MGAIQCRKLGFALQWFSGDLWLACAAGARDAFHLDYLLDELLAQADTAYRPGLSAPAVRQIDSPTATLTFLGDTYFGEWYTERRKARGIDDALQRHGYDYSFAAIAPFFAIATSRSPTLKRR